jgi:hypothetical protein
MRHQVIWVCIISGDRQFCMIRTQGSECHPTKEYMILYVLQGFYSPISRPDEEGYLEMVCRTDVKGVQLNLSEVRPGQDLYLKVRRIFENFEEKGRGDGILSCFFFARLDSSPRTKGLALRATHGMRHDVV